MAQNGQNQTIDKHELIEHVRRIAGTFPQESSDADLLKLAGLVIESDARALEQYLHMIGDNERLRRGHFAAMIASGLLSNSARDFMVADVGVLAVLAADALIAELDKPV